ncbi:sugar fermentation stimulation protein A [Desulfatibacillum alkenivorans DSM 16219]|uniref:Sugar fermentation stimulation protein homolog n=1 Tax=Desulfatibacillum alkenivorans DSM 16219 TaxID=1121393 RepID=A0A1M6E8D4_9BACT|nr:DNA/RNA nuclease SfsA [Desulfatibacillum alkenivorans]SHI81548.1 sugar fermentation stimulation protein A [Desulfatibacillum alkenivorans DSM 16219]
MKKDKGALPWPKLIQGTLLRRYKRFIADVELEDGTVVSAHCPNSGRMTGCSDPGSPVWISPASNPKRKLKYTLEMIKMPDSLVGINTGVPNKLVAKAIEDQVIPELSGYGGLRMEVPYGANSRVDIMLSEEGRRDCLVEVKNCTLVEDRRAMFPDAVTARGLKHLEELEKALSQNKRSVMFFLIQRMDADVFAPADHIDPAYGAALRRVCANGVEALAWDVDMDLNSLRLNRPLPCDLS